MAGAPECMVQDGRGSVFIGTFLADGTSINVCDEHFEGFLISSLETITNKPVAALLASAPEVEDSALPNGDESPEDPEFQQWLDDNETEIYELVGLGDTFEQAVAKVLEKETAPPEPDDSTVESTN